MDLLLVMPLTEGLTPHIKTEDLPCQKIVKKTKDTSKNGRFCWKISLHLHLMVQYLWGANSNHQQQLK